MPLCTSNIRHIANNRNKKCTSCNNHAVMIIFTISPYTDDTDDTDATDDTDDTNDTDIGQNAHSSNHFTSCIDCLNTIQTITIRKYNLKHGIITHYKYFGHNNESIVYNTNNCGMIPLVMLAVYGRVFVAEEIHFT